MKKLKTTVVGMYIRRGLSREEASKNAVLPYVLKSGCKKHPDILSLTRQLDMLYGAKLSTGVIKNGDNQVIFFDCETISDKYAPDSPKLTKGLVSLLSSVVFEPLCENGAFINNIVEREKKTVTDRINALINDKRSWAQLRCVQEVCGDDAFAISKFGEIDEVEKINAKSLYEHYKKIITSSQIDIFTSGEADLEELSAQIREAVKNLEFTDYSDFKTKKIASVDNVKNITEKMEVTQGKLAIGFTSEINAQDKDYPALAVLNSIYGAGTHSKLFNNVREKLSLAYYASSSLNKYKGIITVNAGIEFKNFKKAYDESISQLDEIKKGNISDDEFNFSIKSMINALNGYCDDQRYMQLYSLDCLYLGIDPDIEDYKKRLMSVTKEDCVRVAQKVKENTVYFLTGNSNTEQN